MERCANPRCGCTGVNHERVGRMFCNATCADGYDAHDLADAMCSCGDGSCVVPGKDPDRLSGQRS